MYISYFTVFTLLSFFAVWCMLCIFYQTRSWTNIRTNIYWNERSKNVYCKPFWSFFKSSIQFCFHTKLSRPRSHNGLKRWRKSIFVGQCTLPQHFRKLLKKILIPVSEVLIVQPTCWYFRGNFILGVYGTLFSSLLSPFKKSCLFWIKHAFVVSAPYHKKEYLN